MAVGIGGFIGSCLRFAISRFFSHNTILPFGTLISNITAGLLIGFIIGAEQQSIMISQKTKLFLTTGFLGGLSTFSTFSLETINLFRDGKYFLGAGNIILNLILSLFGVVLGMFLAKLLLAKV